MNIVINLNKEPGLTSNDVLIRVKKLFRARKAGHGGTLDPLAEGLLLIALNEGTKILPYLSSLNKEYLFTARFGIITDTFDTEGAIIEERGLKGLSESSIRDILPDFIGNVQQRPPRYSAIKYQGRPLYDYARKGIAVEPALRTVSIHQLELVDCSIPLATFRVSCSTGTYIRSLCHDMGLALGVGAHIAMLKRTRIGPFTLENSASIEQLPYSKAGLYSIDDALSHMPCLSIPEQLIASARQGISLVFSRLGEASQSLDKGLENTAQRPNIIRLLDERRRTFAIGQVCADRVKIKRILHLH